MWRWRPGTLPSDTPAPTRRGRIRWGCCTILGGVAGRNRHILDGYDYLMALGFTDAARIALTHSFAVPELDTLPGVWDGTPPEWARLGDLLAGVRSDTEDRLAATLRSAGPAGRLLHRAGAADRRGATLQRECSERRQMAYPAEA